MHTKHMSSFGENDQRALPPTDRFLSPQKKAEGPLTEMLWGERR